MGKNTVRLDPVLTSRSTVDQTSEAGDIMATTIKNDASAWETELDELAELIRSVEADETADTNARPSFKPLSAATVSPTQPPQGLLDDRAQEVDDIPEILLPDETSVDGADLQADDDDDAEEFPTSVEPLEDDPAERPVDGNNILSAIDAVEASLSQEEDGVLQEDYVVRAIDAMESRMISQFDGVATHLDATRTDLNREVMELNRKVSALNAEIDALKSRTSGLPGRFFSILMAFVTAGAVFALLSYGPQTMTGLTPNGFTDQAAMSEQTDGSALGETIASTKAAEQPSADLAEDGWSVERVAASIGDYAGKLRAYVETSLFSSQTNPQTGE